MVPAPPKTLKIPLPIDSLGWDVDHLSHEARKTHVSTKPKKHARMPKTMKKTRRKLKTQLGRLGEAKRGRVSWLCGVV